MSIRAGDFRVGDRVKILWTDSIGYGKKGTVVSLLQAPSHVLVRVKVDGGVICSFGLRSSLKRINVKREKVVFT